MCSFIFCIVVCLITITVLFVNTTTTDISCNALDIAPESLFNDGEISSVVQGGVSPYTYLLPKIPNLQQQKIWHQKKLVLQTDLVIILLLRSPKIK